MAIEVCFSKIDLVGDTVFFQIMSRDGLVTDYRVRGFEHFVRRAMLLLELHVVPTDTDEMLNIWFDLLAQDII